MTFPKICACIRPVHQRLQHSVLLFVHHPGLRWFALGSLTTLLVTFASLTLVRWWWLREYLVLNLIVGGILVVVLAMYLNDRGVISMANPISSSSSSTDSVLCPCHHPNKDTGDDNTTTTPK
jgi:hypothetical protein